MQQALPSGFSLILKEEIKIEVKQRFLTDDINELYGTEPDMAMDEEIEELIYDEALFENGYTTQYVVTRRDIDVNKHVHNI